MAARRAHACCPAAQVPACGAPAAAAFQMPGVVFGQVAVRVTARALACGCCLPRHGIVACAWVLPCVGSVPHGGVRHTSYAPLLCAAALALHLSQRAARRCWQAPAAAPPCGAQLRVHTTPVHVAGRRGPRAARQQRRLTRRSGASAGRFAPSYWTAAAPLPAARQSCRCPYSFLDSTHHRLAIAGAEAGRVNEKPFSLLVRSRRALVGCAPDQSDYL